MARLPPTIHSHIIGMKHGRLPRTRHQRKYRHQANDNGPHRYKLPNAQPVKNLSCSGIDSHFTRAKRGQHVPAAYHTEHSTFKGHAAIGKVDGFSICIVQAVGKVGSQFFGNRFPRRNRSFSSIISDLVIIENYRNR